MYKRHLLRQFDWMRYADGPRPVRSPGLVIIGACDPDWRVVASGNSTVDWASVTGEFVVAVKGPDALVSAGTLNDEGALLVDVMKPIMCWS